MPPAKTEVALQFSECCAAGVALQRWLFCSTDVILTRCCAAASEKLQCNIEKAALQESGAFLPLSCGFRAPTFRHPRLGPAETFFSQTFRALPGYPAKSRDIPPKKFDSLGFEGHTELFGPHPFTQKTPTPPEDISGLKSLGLGSFFVPEKRVSVHYPPGCADLVDMGRGKHVSNDRDVNFSCHHDKNYCSNRNKKYLNNYFWGLNR